MSRRVGAAILTGGQSSRMGVTKALVTVDGSPMAARVADAAIGAGCHPVVLVGGDNTELAAIALPFVADLHPGEGPLGGVLSALHEAVHEGLDAVFVAACDVPFLDVPTVRLLLGEATRHMDHVVVARAGRSQPGCAVWPISSLNRVRRCFEDGERSLVGAQIAVGRVELDVPHRALINVNTPDDLHRCADVDSPVAASGQHASPPGDTPTQ